MHLVGTTAPRLLPLLEVEIEVVKTMKTLTIEVPDEIFDSLKETPQELASEIRLAAAAKLYELGKLSSGRAAELAGVSRVRFLHELARYGVPIFDLTEEELAQDLYHA